MSSSTVSQPIDQQAFLHPTGKVDKQCFSAFLLALIFPLGGLVNALRNWRKPWAKDVFWIVCIYLGAIHIYCPEGTILGSGSDGGRYALRLMMWHQNGYTLGEVLKNYLVDQHAMDLYQQFTTWLFASFTDNGHVLFAFWAVVFGFFYSRNIWYVLEKLPDGLAGRFFILVTLFFLVCPITRINGVRMWTALHVYVYALLPYLVEGKKHRLWWLAVPPLIHFSYLYVVLLGLGYIFLPKYFRTGNRAFLLVVLATFILTFFISILNLPKLASALTRYSPGAYSRRIEMYINQKALDRNVAKAALNNWYVAASRNVLHWCCNVLMVAAFFPVVAHGKTNRKELTDLYVFALLFGSLANVMSLIPSGGRFLSVAWMFTVPCILLFLANLSSKDLFYKLAVFASWWLLIPFVVEIRKLFDCYGLAIFGNFVTVFFWESNVPLIQFVKWLV